MNKIKQLRQAKEMKQIELASYLNVTQGNISGWESGKWQPDQDALIKMANLFNVSIDYLVERNEVLNENLKKQAPIPQFSPEELKLIEMYRKCTETWKQTVKQIAKISLPIFTIQQKTVYKPPFCIKKRPPKRSVFIFVSDI